MLNLYFWPLFFAVTIIALLIIPVGRLLNAAVFKTPEASLFRIGIRIYGWIIVRLIPFMTPVQLFNHSDNFPKTGIIVTNHLSAADPYCFGALPGEYAFMTSWPFKIPFYSWVMKKARYLDSSLGWPHILDKSKKLLQQGCSLIIWPEGHRSTDGGLGEFQNGAFRIACETGYPVVPICIKGTEQLMPPRQHFLKPSRISLTVLPPCFPEKTADKRQCIKNLKAKVCAAIAGELNQKHPANV